MDRRKFFKNLAVGTAITIIPLSVLKALEKQKDEILKNKDYHIKMCREVYDKYQFCPFRVNDVVCFYKDNPEWLAMITTINNVKLNGAKFSLFDLLKLQKETGYLISQNTVVAATATIKMTPLWLNQGPKGEPKGQTFTKSLEWVKENTLLFTRNDSDFELWKNRYGDPDEYIEKLKS